MSFKDTFSSVGRYMGAVILPLLLLMSSEKSIAQQCSYGYGSISVTAPAAGASISRGTTTTIRWTDPYFAPWYSGWYNIDYSSDDGVSWNNIVSRLTPSSNSAMNYDWAIPASLPQSSTYRIRVHQEYNTYSWYCALSNPGIGGAFTIFIPCGPPNITGQPTSRSACLGTATTFNVTSSMSNGTYEWRKDGVTLATTTSPSYTVSPVTATSGGLYDVVLRDNCNPTTAFQTSATAMLTVLSAPVIVQNLPPTRSVCENANDTLRVRATGAGRTFQWFKNGVAIAGATDSNFVINNASATTPGLFSCVVTGTCSPAATSVVCDLGVVIRPKLTLEPKNLDLCPGSTDTLKMAVNGTFLVYQWYRNGAPVDGAIGPNLVFANYDKSRDGQYYCVARSSAPNPNNCPAEARTRTVRVTGFVAPTVKANPDTLLDVCLGSNLTLVSEFNGSGLTFQWFRNGVAIPGAQSNSLSVPNIKATDAGNYTCRATGTCNLTATTTAARVVVIAKPVLTTQPAARVLTVGERLDLSVDATDWRTIQWTKNSQNINGATAPTYSIATVTKADAGYYSATVRNSCGGVTSTIAQIVVNDPAVPTPAIQLSTTEVNFGEIPVGYDRSQQLDGLIKNVGTAPLTVTGVAAMPGQFTITNAPAFPLTLDPNQSAGVTVKATPTQQGALAGSLTIQSNDPARPTTSVTLNAAYVLRYDHASSTDFGTVYTTQSKDMCVTLTNTSGVDIVIEQATVSGPSSGSFTVETTLPLAIAAGQTGEVCVKFTPGTTGDKTATISFRSSNGGNSSMSVMGKGDVEAGVIDATDAGIVASPNPMSDFVDVRFSNAAPEMLVTVMSASGQTVGSFRTDAVSAGGSIRWSGRDAAGSPLASGVYTLLFTAGERVVRVPVTIVR